MDVMRPWIMRERGKAMKRVLVVDDDPIYIEVAQALLATALGAQVSSATDGKAAESLLADDVPYDLLMLDLNMPDYDGVQFLDYLRELDFRGPIMIVSGADRTVRAGATGLAKAYGLNVVGVVEKPLTIKKLVPALAHA